jgi:outer membrane protein assembly factor BamB
MHRSNLGWRILLASWCSLYGLTATLRAGDWPQILGPQRSGIADQEKLSGRTVKPVWRKTCGAGLAGVAVADGIAILFHRLKNEETVSAFEATTGKPLWSKGYATTYRAQIVSDNGPRAVPTISGGKVFAFGAQGRLVCLELKSGKPLWERDTDKEYNIPDSYFGSGSSPLVIDQLVIVNVGGDRGSLVAFDVQTGKPQWQSVKDDASYSSPIRFDRDGKASLLALTRLNFVGLDLKGTELFRIPFGSRGPTVNGAVPVMIGNQVLLTASYGIGAKLVDLSTATPTVTWEDELLSSQYTTPIVSSGVVYGIDGRQDGGSSTLKCFDPLTRKVLWQQGDFEYATLVAADNKLLVQHTNGELRIVALEATKYRELATHPLLNGTTRALPALANGLWYLRSESELAVFDLR